MYTEKVSNSHPVYRDGVLLIVTTTGITPACVCCYRAKFIPSRVWSVTVWEPARCRLCRTPSFAEFIPLLQQVATSWTGCDPSNSAADRGTALNIPQELPGTDQQRDRCRHLAPVSYTLL